MLDTKRSIRTIARDIRGDWKNVNYAAVPYLNAMEYLIGVNDTYGHDSARDIVTRFLVNAVHWRGENARRIKAELRELMAK